MGLKIETYENGILVNAIDERNINEVRQQVNDAINNYRDFLFEDEPIYYQGVSFDIDTQSRNNLTAMSTAVAAGVPLPPNFVWRTFTNSAFPMNAETLLDFAGLVMAYINSVYTSSWIKKYEITLLNTLEDLDSYDVTTGWPDKNLTPDVPIID
jgi:hypothetical protein